MSVNILFFFFFMRFILLCFYVLCILYKSLFNKYLFIHVFLIPYRAHTFCVYLIVYFIFFCFYCVFFALILC
ncbi:hypothetical protein HMPREF1584_00939 [Gardnerella vaginalis JCP8481A]|nr:hypothetical protein HMPREF1584_00939 [Gardnerella vaginalis JCP8481A]